MTPDAIRAIIREELARATAPVISTEDAAALAGLASPDRFRRWAKSHRIRPLSRGRWVRQHIEAAITREAAARNRVTLRRTSLRPGDRPEPANLSHLKRGNR
ncbi:MAG: hypothetical protein JJU00_14855 [Opitutales bacterium]|nr:hypothetical protein [Opitutales bacterium]